MMLALNLKIKLEEKRKFKAKMGITKKERKSVFEVIKNSLIDTKSNVIDVKQVKLHVVHIILFHYFSLLLDSTAKSV